MKRIIPVIAAFFLSLLLIGNPAPVFAQDKNSVDGGYGAALEDCRQNGSVALECHAKIVDDIPKLNFIEGIAGPVKGLTVAPDIWQRNPQYAIGLYNNSAVGHINNAISYMYLNQPASTIAFIIDTGQTLGFIPKQAYAQGIGFSGLSPLLPIWKLFRNIAYILLAFVMVIVGFMVMLRKKIDPKTVVTVQNALPKVIMSLVLITFSYAIVGIMIDLMYLIIFFAVSLFKTTGLLPDPAFLSKLVGYNSIEELMTTGGLFTITNTMFPALSLDGGLVDFASDIIGWSWLHSVGIFVIGTVGTLLSGPIAPLTAVGTSIGTSAPIIVAFILVIAILFILIRLFFMFFSAYIQILLSLIFGPIQLLGEALPGSNAFASWVGNLVSNIMVFPISAIMIMLSMMLMKIADTPEASGILWTPPLATLPGGKASSIASLFALGLMATIPNVVASIKEAIKTKPFINAGPGAVLGPVASGAGQLVQLGYQASMIYSPLRHKEHPSTALGRAKHAQEDPTNPTEPR